LSVNRRHFPACSPLCLSAFRLLVLAPLLLGWLLAGCAGTDTVIMVNVVDGQGTLTGVHQLSASITIGGQMKRILVPETPGPAIQFPTSFTVQADRSYSGALTVNVEALDDQGVILAHGTEVRVPSITVGERNYVVVTLGSSGNVDGGRPEGGADAGGDAATDASQDVAPVGGTGGMFGTDGGVGTGGSIGTGGATGSGGFSGSGGANGTGGASGT